MKPTFAAVSCPVIPAPRGTDAARKAAGVHGDGGDQGALFAVEGGFLGWERNAKFVVVSPAGEVRALGIDYEHLPSWNGDVATSISPDTKRLLMKESDEAKVFTFATGEKQGLGTPTCGAAWLDDDRIAIADGKTLKVRRLSTAEELASCALGAVTGLGARADGVIVALHGKTYEPKTRAIEVYRLEGSEIVAIGKKKKVPFTLMVPFEGELYLVERAGMGNWVACFRVEVDADGNAKEGKKAKTKTDAIVDGGRVDRPWAERRVASISIGKKRDDAKLEAALGAFPPKVRTKHKLEQLLDCTVDERGEVGFTIDAGGESKATAASILEVLALAEVKALSHLSLAMDGRGALALAVTKELAADHKGRFASVTGVDASGATKTEVANAVFGGAFGARLERAAMRDAGLWAFKHAGLDALEALDLEGNKINSLPPSLPSLRRLRLNGALYAPLGEALSALASLPQLVELRLGAPEAHYSMLPAEALTAMSERVSRELRELSLIGQPHAGDAIATAFAGAAPGLTTALFARTAVGRGGAEALVGGCPSLASLDVTGNAEAAKGIHAGGSALERLRMTLDDEGAELLAKNQELGAVKRLLLIHGKLGPKGIFALVGSRLFEGLTELTIDGIPLGSWEQVSEPDHIGEEGTALLAESPALASLTYLRLRCATLGDEGARALAESPNLTKLATVDLDANKISPAGIVRLIEGLPALKKLTCQLRDKGGLEKVREAAFRRGIELALFHGLYKM